MPAEEIFLEQGQWWFGSGRRIRTILGSCVALTFWHPVYRSGGMCHILLAGRQRPADAPLDARYADEALALLLSSIAKAGHDPRQYQVRMYGGGRMFGDAQSLEAQGMQALPAQNIDAARTLLRQHRLRLIAEDVGGLGHRLVIFSLDSGEVQLTHTPLPKKS